MDPGAKQRLSEAATLVPSSGAASSGSFSTFRMGKPLQPGEVLAARYEIVQLLGEGGMGAVYKARDLELERMVALKLIRPELAADPEILQRFKQEIILAREITHKNVIRIYDLGEADGTRFITMEYIEGRDLNSLLRDRGKLPVDEAVSIILQVCAGLEAAHAAGVLHRDLKPGNIMLDGNGRAAVMDFGLARSMESRGLTQTGMLLGTMEYMSPEQAKAETLDARSDLFSVGLILYELLTGKLPYKADSALASLLRRTQERAQPPSSMDPSVPKAVSDIVVRCLERDPADRYQSAAQMIADLQAGRPSAGPRSLQISLPGVAMRLPGRPLWYVLALVALVLLTGGVLSLVRRSRPAETTAAHNYRYIAVLPFKVAGTETSLHYVAEGMVDSVSAKLFQLKDVRVASASAVEKVNKDQPLDKLGRALGVGLIVQGTVQGTGDRIRTVLHVDEVPSGRRLLSEEFSGVVQDLLTLEDQIYNRIVAAIDVTPTSEELARVSHPTENIQAYDLYLRGRNAMRGQLDVSKVQSAIKYFEEAARKDPKFTLPYTGLADAYLRMYAEKKESLWSEKALAAAQQAERLGEDLAEVHFALGSVYSATGKSAQAVAELTRALQLAPNSDDGFRRLGDAYRVIGRKEESIQAYRKAIEVNPYYWFNHNALGGAYLRLGDAENALGAFRKAIELEPENAAAYRNIAMAYFRQGKWEDSVGAFQKALELEPHYIAYSNLGTALFYLKRYAESVQMFEKAIAMNPGQFVMVGNLADAYRWAGNQEQALATYDRAIALASKDLQVNPRNAATRASLALYYAKKGNAVQATRFIESARAINPSDAELVYIEAVVSALAGKPEQALAALRGAFQKGYPAQEAQNDPELTHLVSRPEFRTLLDEFKAKRS